MKNLILSLMVLVSLAAVDEARADMRCEFLAQVAASEEAILGFDEFQAVALLDQYAQMASGGAITESFFWQIPGDEYGVHVSTLFDGEVCEILEAYPVKLQ